MKKRTKELLVGATLVGVGTVGAFAVLVDKSEQQIINIGRGGAENMAPVTIQQSPTSTVIQQPANPTQIADQSRIYTHQPQEAGPAYQAQSNGSFTNNSANFQHHLPEPQYTPNQYAPQTNNYPQNTQGLCAPEALAVGIKHFRYDDADPNDLVASGYGSDPKFKIHRGAKSALQELVRAAKADGVTLKPGSIWRSSERQRQIVNNKKRQGQTAKQIYYTSSHPGYSEHHTGLAVDFSPIDHSFARTAGYRWLQQNAGKYGWVQTFTPDYSAYSGVSEESWHWRYEGKNGEFAHIFEASRNRRC